MVERGITSANYKSAFFSDYHPWFVEMGYPRLDLCTYEDGSWGIIELQNGGLIPSEAVFLDVLTGIKNLEPNYSTIQRLVHSLDVYRDEYLDHELKKSKLVEEEWDYVNRRRTDLINKTAEVFAKNDHLKERIAKRGAKALDLIDMSRYVPRYRF